MQYPPALQIHVHKAPYEYKSMDDGALGQTGARQLWIQDPFKYPCFEKHKVTNLDTSVSAYYSRGSIQASATENYEATTGE